MKLGNFVTRKAVRLAEAEKTVAPILDAVEKRGDEAVLEYARKFDHLEGNSFFRPAVGMGSGRSARVRPSLSAAIETASQQHPRIRGRCSCPRKPGRGFPTAAGWATSCGRSNPWAPTFPPAATHCHPRC